MKGSRRRDWRLDVAVACYVTAAIVLLGAPVGLLWSALAPHARIAISASGATFADGATEVFVAGDGWFLGVCAVAGLATGLLTWLLARRSGRTPWSRWPSAGCSRPTSPPRSADGSARTTCRAAAAAGRPGTYVANVALQAKQAVLVWPIAALATFVTLVVSRADESD